MSRWRRAVAIAVLPGTATIFVPVVGEGLALGSAGILIWSAAFFAVNWAYFVVSEEPGLERRFGEEHRTYKRAVPRWLPRTTRHRGI